MTGINGAATMADSRRNGRRRGVTLIELMIVLVILGTLAGLALPRLNLSAYRADAAAQQVRSVFQTAQRTSLTRQYDVIVSVDTIRGGLRIAEDVNNNGAIELSEWKFWRPPGEGNRFEVPPAGVRPSTGDTYRPIGTSVAGPALKTVDGLPSVIFHRDGSTSSEMEVYMSSRYRSRTDFRGITLTRSTGRAELYQLAGTGAAARWRLAR
jgi:prepilin-type N-terminal cleavage/methylation domain-containing protein